MDEEGIMALPQGMNMQGDQAQQPRPTVTSAQSYDAAQTALGMTNPAEQAMLRTAIRDSLADEQLTPDEIEAMIMMFEALAEDPAGYPALREKLISSDLVDPEDLPEQYDVEFLGVFLAVLNELQMSQGQGAMDPAMASPMVEGLPPLAMAEGGLADVASYLASKGRHGDTMLAHITPQEAALLKRRGGSGTINPETGLPEFFLKKLGKSIKGAVKSVGNAIKKVAQSPVGRILLTVGATVLLGPAGAGLTMGTAAGLASAGVTLAGGGSVKQALVAGAMGYIGGGGTIMGASPLSAVGGYLPGAAGSALNTGLATGVIGAGVGKLAGMSTDEALRMGLTSGLSAAGSQAYQNYNAPAAAPAPAPAQANQPVALQSSDATVGADGTIGAAGPAGPAGAIGPTGTAQDMLASMPAAPAAPAAAPAPAEYDFYSEIGIDPKSVSPTLGPSPTNIQIERGNLGMTGPIDTVRQFVQEPINVGKDLYDTYLSPSRAGLPSDAGFFRKYAPLAAVGTLGAAALGAFKQEPGEEEPLFDTQYTGSDYIRDNPLEFQGGLDSSYRRPKSPPSSVVPPTSFGPAIPLGGVAPVYMGGGITNSPGGVAQPYNVAGLYGVPLIYGQGGQPQGFAKGGDARPTKFPRRTGPINGPGTGTSDDIPAMLSDGEFVFTAKAVRNAGNGSRRKGAARMYKLMKMLEGGPVKGK